MDSRNIEIAERKDKNLLLDILGCGKVTMRKNEEYLRTIKDRFVLFCVTKNDIIFNGSEYDGNILEGETFVAFPFQDFKIKSHDNDTCFYWIEFTGFMIEIYLARGNIYRWNPKIENDKENFLSKQLTKIYDKAQNLPNRYCTIASLLYSMFSYLIEINNSMLRIDVRNNAAYLVSNTLETVRGNISKPISIDELAEQSNLTRRQLSIAFKNAIKMTPKKFFILLRIQKACQLLRTTNDTIATIASKVGYSDQYNFSKSFKKITGLTTLQYKRGEEWEPEIDCELVYEKLTNSVRYIQPIDD